MKQQSRPVRQTGSLRQPGTYEYDAVAVFYMLYQVFGYFRYVHFAPLECKRALLDSQHEVTKITKRKGRSILPLSYQLKGKILEIYVPNSVRSVMFIA